jgi:hypothetical protein
VVTETVRKDRAASAADRKDKADLAIAHRDKVAVADPEASAADRAAHPQVAPNPRKPNQPRTISVNNGTKFNNQIR